MNATEQRKNARDFVKRWQQAEGNEQRESNKFWLELCSEVLGIPNPTHVLDFERKVRGRRIDVFFEDVGVLIENKSRGVDLDAPEVRGKDKYGNVRQVTPFEQAKWYADNITPRSIMPTWIITCNFDEIRVHDLNREDAETNFETIRLVDLPNEFHRLSFFTSKENSRVEREKALSIKAGEVVGRLYDAFSKAYLDIDNNVAEQQSLNILITRIVFLLYAEDADLLHEHDAFYNYLKNFQVAHMRQALIDLFAVLKTPEGERDPYLDPALLAFPYVNGGLFERDAIIPRFDLATREILLNEASAEFDWSSISPTIFGAVVESTLNPETRHAGGMHYTSVENIHKVVGPLFYDALKDELTAIEGLKSQKERTFKLRTFRQKLASIKLLDPACGSGNFLTESYLLLRKLENRVMENLYGDQMVLAEVDPVLVQIDQFYGIEINDFAVEVAKTALWIAELQMLDETREILNMWIDALPLKSNDNIHEGNALRMDWEDVLPSESCSYLCGNPPFLGSAIRTKAQTADLEVVFGKEKKWGKCDYCVGWYRKAADYMRDTDCRAALVSTNSITQGEQ
ncbi:MAG: class I SAM-dependent DNA methyltransferase, partial [Atopobiaceae bacterium]|nr:class I SAM-dependent DNA methyltransferase [Atopobiaceae bacterium]